MNDNWQEPTFTLSQLRVFIAVEERKVTEKARSLVWHNAFSAQTIASIPTEAERWKE